MKSLLLIPVLALLAQDPQVPSIEQDWSRLRARLDASASAEPETALDRDRRIALLQGFLERWPSEDDAGRPELLGARSRLGSLHLAGLESAQALIQFAAILNDAPADALDARGRALYGKAQALLLQGRMAPARAALEQLRRDMVGTRWAAHALIALEHLADDEERARVGEPAPKIGPRLDRTGKSRSLVEPPGEPVLLLFLSPFDERGIEVAKLWIRRAREAGLPTDQILVFGLSAEAPELNRLVARHGLEGVLLPAQAGFLDVDLLRYRVRALPSSALIGPDGVLLAQDLPPARLRQVIAELLR